jgi:hypothetical protein
MQEATMPAKSLNHRRRHGERHDITTESLERGATVLQECRTRYRDFARESPEAAALWCLAIGFALGWKLKIW